MVDTVSAPHAPRTLGWGRARVLRICTLVIPRDRCAGPSTSAPTSAGEWMRARLPPVTARAQDQLIALEFYMAPATDDDDVQRTLCVRANALALWLLVDAVVAHMRDNPSQPFADFIIAPAHESHVAAVVRTLESLGVGCTGVEQPCSAATQWAEHAGVGCWELRCAPATAALPTASDVLALCPGEAAAAAAAAAVVEC